MSDTVIQVGGETIEVTVSGAPGPPGPDTAAVLARVSTIEATALGSEDSGAAQVNANGGVVYYRNAIASHLFFGNAGNQSSTGAALLAMGDNALVSAVLGGNITAIGRNVLANHVGGGGVGASGGGVVAIGEDAMLASIDLTDCTGVGHGVLKSCLHGVGATGVGKNCLLNLTAAANNTAYGDSAGRDLVDGELNALGGYGCAAFNIGGSRNAIWGQAGLYYGLQSSESAGVGYEVLTQVEGSGNAALGCRAGASLLTGDDNVFAGRDSGNSVSQKVDAVNTIAIGADSYTDADNQTVIGNSLTTHAKVFGRFEGSRSIDAVSNSVATYGLSLSISGTVGFAIGVGASDVFVQSFSGRALSLNPEGNAIKLTSIGDYADDAAAAAGGVPVAGIYRTGSALKVRVA